MLCMHLFHSVEYDICIGLGFSFWSDVLGCEWVFCYVSTSSVLSLPFPPLYPFIYQSPSPL